MKKIFTWFLIVLLEFTIMVAPGQAIAQTSPTSSYTGLAALNKIISGASGVTNVSIPGTTTASAGAAEAAVVSKGLSIPVPTTAAARFSAARIASLAGRAMKVGSAVGIASIVIPFLADKYGVKVCTAAQGFICQDVKTTTGVYTVGGTATKFTSAGDAGRYRANQVCNENGAGVGSDYCPAIVACSETVTTWACSTTTTFMPSISGARVAGPDTVIPDQPLQAEALASMAQTEMEASATKQQAVFDAVKASGTPYVTSDVPVTVTAPPVTTPAIKETSTIQNEDGTTSTKVVSTATTVTPVVTGTTMGDTKISYPATTTSTTTITNNTTNVTNTTNTKTDEVAQPVKQADPVEPVKDLCAANPALNICKNSTVTGECKATTCSGDAISCAIAKEAAEANCRAVAERKEIEAMDSFKTGRDAIGGVPDGLAGVPTPGNARQVAIPVMDSSGWLGGGACFTDKTFTVQGRTITIPFSKACDYLVALRYAMMIVAMLVSFRMLSGAIIRE